MGLKGLGLTSIGGSWIITSGFTRAYIVPPSTGYDWKPAAWNCSPMLVLGMSTFMGPSPLRAEK